MAVNKKVFVQNKGAGLYLWSPDANNYSAKVDNINSKNARPNYCNAIGGSQGDDWITTYVYDTALINYNPARLAYVECDYVE